MPLRTIRTIVLGMAVAIASITTAAVPASAAPAPLAQAATSGRIAPAVDQGAVAAAPCVRTSTVVLGVEFGGRRLCDYWVVWNLFSNGTLQVYVVGTDHGVWTRWQTAGGTFSGWQPLKDGKVKPGDGRSIDITGTGNAPTIWVIGMEQATRWWCITRNPSTGWGNWHVCTR